MLYSSMSIAAFAADNVASEERTLVLEIRNDKVTVAETGLIPTIARMFSAPTETISFLIEETATATSNIVLIDITAMEQISAQGQKLQATELLLAELDYSQEQISAMSDKNKLALTNGTELCITRASVTPKPNDSAYNSEPGWTCSLSYTRQDVDTYRFMNFSYNLFPQGRWSQAIAITGFSIASSTVELEYQYNQVEYNGDYINTHMGTVTLSNYSNHDAFINATKSISNGAEYAYFEYRIPHSFIQYPYYTLTFEATATNVTLPPAAGGTGGQFSIWGHMDHTSGFKTPLTFNLGSGIGISIPIGNEVITPCKTYLEAVLYR